MNSKSIINRKVKNLTATALGALVMSGGIACAADKPADADNFYKSGKVASQKVEFNNQYKMKMAGNLFLPGDMDKGAKYPAIVVGHPMGAVKEQSGIWSDTDTMQMRFLLSFLVYSRAFELYNIGSG